MDLLCSQRMMDASTPPAALQWMVFDFVCLLQWKKFCKEPELEGTTEGTSIKVTSASVRV